MGGAGQTAADDQRGQLDANIDVADRTSGKRRTGRNSNKSVDGIPPAAMTNGFSRISRSGGRSIFPVEPIRPRTTMAAYKLIPLAQATPSVRAIVSAIPTASPFAD